MTIERESSTPLYIQVREDLRRQIEDGEFPEWHPLPLEAELASRYGVGRITIKHALSDLAKDGLLTRIKRKGTFVSPAQSQHDAAPCRTGTLAFIVPDIEDLFICEIYRGLAAAARQAGYRVSVYSSERNAAIEAENIAGLSRQREDGAVIFPNWGRANAEVIVDLKKSGYPFVLVNRFFRDIQTDYVVTDNRAGGECAVNHLLDLGHRRIGCLGWVTSTAVEDRLEGYRLALGRHGIPYDEELVTSIMDGPPEQYAGVEPASGGYEEMRKLLCLKDRPTAVFAVSDRLAAGALRALREAGISVPGDISMVGFDNVRYAVDLGLTSVAQPAAETGERAVSILLERIGANAESGFQTAYRQIVLPVKLIVRQTSGIKCTVAGSVTGD